jgi:hypothetical protein
MLEGSRVDLAALPGRRERPKGATPAAKAQAAKAQAAKAQAAKAQAAKAQAAKAQAAQWGFNRRGVVTAASHAYIRPSLGNAIATAGQGPQGPCFLRPVSLVSALQSTR